MAEFDSIDDRGLNEAALGSVRKVFGGLGWD